MADLGDPRPLTNVYNELDRKWIPVQFFVSGSVTGYTTDNGVRTESVDCSNATTYLGALDGAVPKVQSER